MDRLTRDVRTFPSRILQAILQCNVDITGEILANVQGPGHCCFVGEQSSRIHALLALTIVEAIDGWVVRIGVLSLLLGITVLMGCFDIGLNVRSNADVNALAFEK